MGKLRQVLDELEVKFYVFGVSLRFEYAKHKLYNFARVEGLLHEGEHAIAHRPQIEKILHEGLDKRQLTDHEIDVAPNFRINGHRSEKGQDLRQEEQRGADRSSHFMRNCRRERLGVLSLLSLLEVLLGEDARLHLFGGVAHEDNDCLLALVSLLLDFNREKPVVEIFNHGFALASHQGELHVRLAPTYLLVKALLIGRIEDDLLPYDVLDRLVFVHLLDPIDHFLRVIDAAVHEQVHVKVCE